MNDRLKYGGVDEREVNWRDRWVGRGEREERHGSQSAHTFKQAALCCVLRETSTQLLYTWKRGDV